MLSECYGNRYEHYNIVEGVNRWVSIHVLLHAKFQVGWIMYVAAGYSHYFSLIEQKDVLVSNQKIMQTEVFKLPL